MLFLTITFEKDVDSFLTMPKKNLFKVYKLRLNSKISILEMELIFCFI